MKIQSILLLVCHLANGQTQGPANINFQVPDLSAKHKVDNVNVILRAYRVDKSNENYHWVSIGHPYFLKNQRGSLYEYNTENIYLRLQLLSEDQEAALKKAARHIYGRSDNFTINLIPLQSVRCVTSFMWKDELMQLSGEAVSTNEYETAIEIPCPKNSECRKGLSARTKDKQPLHWKCVFSAGGQEQFKNRINISSNLVKKTIIKNNLFGDAKDVYVTREQVASIADELRKNLQIEESYELESVEFNAKLVQKLISMAQTSFQYVPRDIAIEKLSNYGYSTNVKDLKPNEITKDFKEKSTTYSLANTQNTQNRVADAASSKISSAESSKIAGKADMLATSIEHSQEKSKTQSDSIQTNKIVGNGNTREWSNSDSNKDANDIEGLAKQAISLNVALISKDAFTKDLSILYNKVLRKDVMYQKEITIVADTAMGIIDRQFMQLRSKVDERRYEIEALKMDHIEWQNSMREIENPFESQIFKCERITDFNQTSANFTLDCGMVGENSFLQNIEYAFDSQLTKAIKAITCCEIVVAQKDEPVPGYYAILMHQRISCYQDTSDGLFECKKPKSETSPPTPCTGLTGYRKFHDDSFPFGDMLQIRSAPFPSGLTVKILTRKRRLIFKLRVSVFKDAVEEGFKVKIGHSYHHVWSVLGAVFHKASREEREPISVNILHNKSSDGNHAITVWVNDDNVGSYDLPQLIYNDSFDGSQFSFYDVELMRRYCGIEE